MTPTMKGSNEKRTICEVIREINDIVQEDCEQHRQIRKRLLEATGMAKKMSKKLLEYNKEVFKGWWDENPDYEKAVRKRIDKNYLVGEKGDE